MRGMEAIDNICDLWLYKHELRPRTGHCSFGTEHIVHSLMSAFLSQLP
jgi:hypothetical protein